MSPALSCVPRSTQSLSTVLLNYNQLISGKLERFMVDLEDGCISQWHKKKNFSGRNVLHKLGNEFKCTNPPEKNSVIWIFSSPCCLSQISNMWKVCFCIWCDSWRVKRRNTPFSAGDSEELQLKKKEMKEQYDCNEHHWQMNVWQEGYFCIIL